MAQQDRVRARSRSLQTGGGDEAPSDSTGSPAGEAIRHARLDSGDLASARALVAEQLGVLPRGCVLELELGIDPAGLADDLAERGAHPRIEKIARRRWTLLLQPPGDPERMDLCDLEAPLPMQRVLEAAARLGPGEALIAHTPRFPRPLLALLDERALDWEATEAADASALLWVRRPG